MWPFSVNCKFKVGDRVRDNTKEFMDSSDSLNIRTITKVGKINYQYTVDGIPNYLGEMSIETMERFYVKIEA